MRWNTKELPILICFISVTECCPHTPTLQSLHWLPVKCRIKFKVLLLVFKCLNRMAPSYLTELLQFRDHQSSKDSLLLVPRTECTTFGDRDFSVYGPRQWNKLPKHIRERYSVDSFKPSLKTYLFAQCFQTT